MTILAHGREEDVGEVKEVEEVKDAEEGDPTVDALPERGAEKVLRLSFRTRLSG